MIKKCRLSDIPGLNAYKHVGKRIADIEAFIQSGDDCCEVVLKEGEKAFTIAGTLNNAIRNRQYYKDVCYAISRNGRAYLIRKEEMRLEEVKNA